MRTQVAKDVLSEPFHNNGTLQVVTLTSVFSVDQMAEMVGLPVDRVAKAVPLPAVTHHRGITVTTGKPAINERIFSQLGSCQPVANEERIRFSYDLHDGPDLQVYECLCGFHGRTSVPDKVASQYVAKCMGTILYDAEQRCSKGTAGLLSWLMNKPGGLNESNISDLVDAGVFDACKSLSRKLWTD